MSGIKNQMSLQDTLKQDINKFVNIFIDAIVTQHNLNKDDLISIWDNTSGSSGIANISKSVCKKAVVAKDSNENINGAANGNAELAKLSKIELVELCKSKGLKVTGNKTELISYIVNGEKKPAAKVASESKNKVSMKEMIKTAPAIAALAEIGKSNKVKLQRNKYGRLEHSETGFIFKNEKVIGKQNPNGEMDDLTSDDIELCHMRNYEYESNVLNNLDKKSTLDNVQVDELDESEKSESIESEDIELDEDIEEEIEDEVFELDDM